MRTRKSILIITLILTLGGFSLYYGWHFSRANEKIRTYFIEKLKPVISEKFTVKTLQLSLGAVHLKDIHIDEENYTLFIEDARIGYSIFSFLRTGFVPNSIANDILFIKPRLVIKPKFYSRVSLQDSLPLWDPLIFQKYQEVFDFIKRVTISRGTILLTLNTNETIRIANNIEGWITFNDSKLVFSRIEGKLFNSAKTNLSLISRLNLTTGQPVQFDLAIDQFEIKQCPPQVLPTQLRLNKGILNGHLKLAKNTPLHFNGDIQIENADYMIADSVFHFKKVNVAATISDDDLVIHHAQQRTNDSNILIKGNIRDIFSPKVDLMISSEDFEMAQAGKFFLPIKDLQTDGRLNFQIHIQDSIMNPSIDGEIAAANFSINNIDDNHFNLKFAFKDSFLNITDLNGQIVGIHLNGNGSIARILTTPLVNLKITAHKNLNSYFQRFGIHRIPQGDVILTLKIAGAPNDPLITGDFETTLTNLNQETLTFTNFLTFNNGKFDIKPNGRGKQLFELSGEISKLREKPIFVLNLKNTQQLLEFFYPDYPLIAELPPTHCTLQGNHQHYDVYGEMLQGEQRKLVLLLSEVVHQDTSYRINGEVIFNPEQPQRLKSTFRFTGDSTIFAIDSLSIADFLKVRGQIKTIPENNLSGIIEFKNTPIQPFLAFLFPSMNTELQGKLVGQIDIDGILSNPHINGQIRLNELIINKIGTYKSEFSFNFENDVFSLNNFWMQQNKKTIASGRGFYNHQSKRIDFNFKSPAFSANELFMTFGANANVIKGEGLFDLKFSNTIQNPDVNGAIQITNGQIHAFHFDSLHCIFGNGISEEPVLTASQSDSNLIINKFSLKRNQEFEIHAAGTIPYSNEREININVGGNGNFLAILPELTDYYIETKSKGQLSAQIVGRVHNPQIRNGQIQLTDGYLRVKSVFDKISKIKCSLKFFPDRRFLHLENLSGLVRGELLKISNVEYAQVSGRGALEPFYISDWGLNLGILQLETSSKGVPLRIPGLMEKGELGWFRLTGLNPNEKAYLAGPWDRPVARATITLRNLNFTYPFLETNIDSLSPTIQILESIDWDVRVIPAKDTRYVRTIYGAPDAVYVNLVLNESGEGLRFTGAVGDESLVMEGIVESNRGFVEYLDFNFRIENAGARFDKSSIFPIVYGKAKTAIVDSAGYSNNLWLTLYTIDPITREKLIMGRWDEPNLHFEISSDNVNLGITESQILTSLGYSAKNLRAKAPDILGISADNLLFKPLFRPFERKIERVLGLDFVKFRSRIARNLLERNFSPKEYRTSNFSLLRNSQVVLGKYLTDHWFFLYTGELESPLTYEPSLPTLGLCHTLGLEYQIKPNLLLEMEYNYNSMLLKNKVDKKIMLRHSFPF